MATGKNKGDVRQKFHEMIEAAFDKQMIREGVDYLRNNKVEAGAGLIGIVGFLISLWSLWVGGLIVGVMFGVYFSGMIVDFCKGVKTFAQGLGWLQSLLLLILLLTLFLAAPSVFIGVALGVALTYFIKRSIK